MPAALWRRSAFIALFLVAFVPAATAFGQYFGQNKVQYRTLTFQVLTTEHFDIYFYESERKGVEIAARLAERWHARLERLFGHRLSGRQPLVLYGSHADFEQTNVIGGTLTEGTGGVTELLRRRIVLPLGGPIADTDHVIGHELVHAFQFDLTARPGMGPGENRAQTLPLWFVEGMAEYLSLGPVDANTAMWLRDAAREEQLPAIKDLDDPKYFPYRWGQAFWAYVAGRWGDRIVARLLTSAAALGVKSAIEMELGVKVTQLSNDWQESIRRTYAGVIEATSREVPGRIVIRGKERGDLNVGPSLSPDGRWIAFLSSRSFVSTDLYIAETATGRIVHKLTSTSTDPHYSSLQFIYSGGAWDAEGRRLAVATVTAGHAALAIFDGVSGTKERDIDMSGVDELLNPTWSPTGDQVAFSGMSQGVTDLFVYDLATSDLRRLTDDAFADLQPAWSPDGSRIAFVTDRFSTDVRTLAAGAYDLALIDPRSRAVERVPGPALEHARRLNPQWSPDGQALYFISDRGGIANVYRLTLATEDVVQITAAGTGVSGITGTSPALSVSSRSGLLAFSVYQGAKYDIYTLDPSPRGSALSELTADAATLPPLDRGRSDVVTLLSNPTFGLPQSPSAPAAPYKPRLSLEGAAQSTVGVGVSRFGSTVGGGVSLYFGDMLSNRLLVTAVGLNSGWNGSVSPKDALAEVAFINRARRWNWGVIGAQVPYLSGGFQTTLSSTPSGDLLESNRLITFRQTEQSATGIVAYPFDRARRVEFQGGATHISFDQIVNTTTYSLLTGTLFENSTQTTSLARSLTLGSSSAAYVFDTTSFGATSPVHGQRYRVEADPTFGSINFTGLLADYRRYEMPVSFYTVAARVVHYGRYGSGAEDFRLFPLYIGYPGLVRGYDVTTLNASECVASATSDCPLIDRLLGSRILVGNLEFRMPLLRPFGVSSRMYGPVPVEVAVFADSGVAWTSHKRPGIFGGSRGGVASAGVAFRVNLFGFAVGEFDVTRPFQRPDRGWTYAFNLLPGW